jgi:hypothetical protein
MGICDGPMLMLIVGVGVGGEGERGEEGIGAEEGK